MPWGCHGSCSPERRSVAQALGRRRASYPVSPPGAWSHWEHAPGPRGTVGRLSRSRAPDSPGGLVKTKLHLQGSFFFFSPRSKSGKGPKELHFNKHPGDAEAVLPGATLGEPRFQGSCRPPICMEDQPRRPWNPASSTSARPKRRVVPHRRACSSPTVLPTRRITRLGSLCQRWESLLDYGVCAGGGARQPTKQV